MSAFKELRNSQSHVLSARPFFCDASFQLGALKCQNLHVMPYRVIYKHISQWEQVIQRGRGGSLK